MKKIKYIIPLIILFIAIGFAAISYTLNLDGNAGLAGDLDNFNVYYSNTYVNGVEDYSVITSPTELDFTTTLKEPGTTYSITYDVTNGSKHFDAQLTMTCTSGDTYMSVVNNFDTSTNLEALGTRSGTITLKKLKSIASNEITAKTVSCTLTATPVERTTLGEGTAIDKQYAVLKATSEEDTTMFRAPEYKEKIKTITFQDTINVPEEAIESWDIGVAQNGNVMAYLVTNADDATMYDLYIQANGKIYANRDMSYWFYNFQNLDAINNLSLLDTSFAVDMSGIFWYTGYNSTIFTMDVSNFDTSNVTNMYRMFDRCGNNSSKLVLDVSEFDTSKVTNMRTMFQSTARNNHKDFTLDVSNFDTSNVTDMSYMFNYAGENSEIFELNVSNFDTKNVESMEGMLANVGRNNPNFTLDVGNFDTSNVTNMRGMFNQTGSSSTVFTLDISNFNTSKVTNMDSMFSRTGYSNPNFTLDISHFDTSNVVNYYRMFWQTGYNSTKFKTSITIKNPNVENYTEMFYYTTQKAGSEIKVNYTSETESLVDDMIATKVESPNVVKGTLVN